ncbi:DnaJ-domain-containing protein [Coemansia reversa NRRL 1564]|uniref:Diphthamide biosynthesis protein 4 n=1 Tax=Coemansia reversa (strain ATCC 12441 / NRRL 1564) TaxID=763665 RepID=A0A2G5B7K8_COERN|nr:DnaJ-domain-containing protein [Coemansia reversa NRRL 1564]|eukprot:PIA14989.1 DnaJ-domain-containing protein [Coemansia reversa NRRL 1564]
MEHVDYYNTLGIPATATYKVIKQAYYDLSRKVHPDSAVKDKQSQETNLPAFHQLSVAWEVLGDHARRREYDRHWSAYQNRAHGVVQDEVDLDDMEFDSDTRKFSYPCRCSGSYIIAEDDLDAAREIAPCTDCSLKIRVLYEVMDCSDSDQNDSHI